MSKKVPAVVVTDTSVLINFLAVDRMDLIEACEQHFLVTNHVEKEIKEHYAERFARFQVALERGVMDQIRVDDPQEVETFSRLSRGGRLGLGECSAIAVAIHRGYIVAIDDKKAIKQALALCSTLQILTTQDFMVSLIQAGLLDVAKADKIKEEWATHHCFKLKINSFLELL